MNRRTAPDFEHLLPCPAVVRVYTIAAGLCGAIWLVVGVLGLVAIMILCLFAMPGSDSLVPLVLPAACSVGLIVLSLLLIQWSFWLRSHPVLQRWRIGVSAALPARIAADAVVAAPQGLLLQVVICPAAALAVLALAGFGTHRLLRGVAHDAATADEIAARP